MAICLCMWMISCGLIKDCLDQAARVIQDSWTTSTPEVAEVNGAAMRFLGIEIQRWTFGGWFVLSPPGKLSLESSWRGIQTL